MRCLPGLLASLVLLGVAGCTSPDPSGAPGSRTSMTPAPAKGGGLGNPPPLTDLSTNRPAATPVVLPASGRIHSVNAGLRFVVIDYTLGGIPPLQSLLNVYRNQEKVGQLRLSGPERNGFVAADILEGFLQIDDEVRID